MKIKSCLFAILVATPFLPFSVGLSEEKSHIRRDAENRHSLPGEGQSMRRAKSGKANESPGSKKPKKGKKHKNKCYVESRPEPEAPALQPDLTMYDFIADAENECFVGKDFLWLDKVGCPEDERAFLECPPPTIPCSLINDRHRFIRQFANTHRERYHPIKVVTKGERLGYDKTYEHYESMTKEELLAALLPFPLYHEDKTDIESDIEKIEYYNPFFGVDAPFAYYRQMFNVDGMIILWKGKVVYERYFNDYECEGCKPEFKSTTRHSLYSASKNFIGLLIELLLADDEVDMSEDDLISDHIEELKWKGNNWGGAYEFATIRQLLDMTTDIDLDENGNVCSAGDFAEISDYLKKNPEATGIKLPIPRQCAELFSAIARDRAPFTLEFWQEFTNGRFVEYPGANGGRDHDINLRPNPEPLDEETFVYRTTNTNVLGWLLENKTNGKGAEYFAEKLWSKIGQDNDLFLYNDQTQFTFWGGAAAVTLMDFARFGEMMRNNGTNHKGEQVVPESIVERIRNGGSVDNLKQFGRSSVNRNYNCFVTNSTEYYDWQKVLENEFSKRDPYGYCQGIKDGLFENYDVMKYANALADKKNIPRDTYINGLPGYTYHSQYWGVPGHYFSHRGVRGQNLVVFPEADLVIATVSSNQITQPLPVENLYLSIAAYFLQKMTPD